MIAPKFNTYEFRIFGRSNKGKWYQWIKFSTEFFEDTQALHSYMKAVAARFDEAQACVTTEISYTSPVDQKEIKINP